MAAAPAVQQAPFPMYPHLFSQPFSSDFLPCESQQTSQLAEAFLSPYAADTPLSATGTGGPGSSGVPGHDFFFLPEPVPLDCVGDFEPLSSCEADPAPPTQPVSVSWESADMQPMLATQFPKEQPLLKREGQVEAVCSTSRSRQQGARSPPNRRKQPSRRKGRPA